MASPPPEQLLERILGPLTATALARSGPLVPALAASALRAWASTRPAGYSGSAPDGLPFAKAESLVERCGLAKTERLPAKVDAAVTMLVRLGEQRADQAVRMGTLSKTIRGPKQLQKGVPSPEDPAYPTWEDRGVQLFRASSQARHHESHSAHDALAGHVDWGSSPDDNVHANYPERGPYTVADEMSFVRTMGPPNASPDDRFRLWARSRAARLHGLSKSSDTFHDLRARATELGQHARQTDDPKHHREAALHFRKVADAAKRQDRNDAVGFESEATYHESRALNSPSSKPTKTKKAEPTPHAKPDQGGPAKPREPARPTPPQAVAPPTVRPPKQPRTTLEFTKAEAEKASCRRCGLGYFELSKTQRPEFTGCLCHSELAKSATVKMDGEKLLLELDVEFPKAQRLAVEMKKVPRA